MTLTPGSAARAADAKRELLARHLRTWVPAALHRGRRATYVHGYADLDDARSAEVALRVLAGQSGLVRGRELVMVAVADDSAPPARRLAAVQRETPASAALVVHTVPGGTDARLGVALKAAGATGAPLFAFLDAGGADAPPALATVTALATGRPAEVLLVLAPFVLSGLAAGAADGDRFFGDSRPRDASGLPPGRHRALLADVYRAVLRNVGFPLVSMVELVGDDEADGEVLVFATTSGKSLEAFKEALWVSFDGMRCRDPGDPMRHSIDISPAPDPGPLRRALQARLSAAGPSTVTALRTFTLTRAVHRASDTGGVLEGMLAAGTLVRTPEHGRLGGDVVIALAGPAVGE